MKIFYKLLIQRFIVVVLPLLGLLATGCQENFVTRQFDKDEEYMQIYDYIKTRSDLSIYKDLCDYTGFSSQVSTAGSYTVFVPCDSAFQSLFERLKIEKIEDKTPEYWMHYMTYHAVEAKINTSSFVSGNLSQYTMFDKKYFLVSDASDYTAIRLNNAATITEYNIDLKNGYVDVLDGVLMPPITPIYDLLKEQGGYSVMLGLFETYGLKHYLTDSLITLFVEPDYVLEQQGFVTAQGFEKDSVENMEDWLSYHIIPGRRYFKNELDNQMLQPLYKGDMITFNYNSDNYTYYMNLKYRLNQREEYKTDWNGLNGIVHSMQNVVKIIDHSAGTIKTNLYGRTNEKKGYEKNVFADAPAMVIENMFYNSYHQAAYGKDPEPPICVFDASEAGDAFSINVKDVVKGTYKVRLVYNKVYSSTLTLMFKNVVVASDIKLATQDGDFKEYTTLKYKDCGIIEVNERGDIEIKFVIGDNSGVMMDRLDLIPVVNF